MFLSLFGQPDVGSVRELSKTLSKQGDFCVLTPNFFLMEVGLPKSEDSVANRSNRLAENFDGTGVWISSALFAIDLIEIALGVVVESAVWGDLRELVVIW